MPNARGCRCAAGLWVAVLLSLAAAGADAQSRGERLLQSAHALLERGLNDQASDEYHDAINALDDSERIAEARYGLAIAQERSGQAENAIDTLAAIPVDLAFEFRTDTDVLLMTLLARSDRSDEALDAAERVLARTDHAAWPAAASLSVELLQRLERHRDAAHTFERTRDILSDRSPESFARAALFAGLAEAALAQSDHEHISAARLLELAASDHASAAAREQALLAAGHAWQRAGNTDLAERAFRRSIAVSGPRPASSARVALGALLRAEARPADAIEILAGVDRSSLDAAARARADLELGLAQLDTGAIVEAAHSLDRVLESDDGTLVAAASYWRAKADLRRERFEEAAARLQRTADQHPDSPLAVETLYDLGVAHQRAGRADQARNAFALVRTQHPDHPLAEQAHLAGISIALAQGANDDVIDRARRFLQERGRSEHAPRVTMMLGEALLAAGRFNEAAECASMLARNTDPSLAARASLVHGLALHAAGSGDEALPMLTRACDALGDDSSASPAYLALAQIHTSNESWADARDAATAFLRLAPAQDPLRADAGLLQGIALARRGETSPAADALAPLVDAANADVAAHARLELGQLYRAQGLQQDASALFVRLIDEQPDSRFVPHALRLLAEIAEHAGDTDSADALYARAAASSDGDVAQAAQLDRARVLLTVGRAEEAAEALSDASSMQALAWRTIALSRAGRHSQAIAIAQQIDRRDLAADLADALTLHTADSERHLGNATRAAELLRPLLDSPRLAREAALRLAEVSIEADDTQAAVGLLERALAPSSDGGTPDLCAALRYQLAWCRYQLDDHRAVVDVLGEHACDMAAFAAPSALLLGEAHASLGRHSDAAASFTHALTLGLPDEQAEQTLLRLGESCAAAHDWTTSATAFAQHRSSYPDSSRWFQAAFGAGWAAENQGHHERAIEQYRIVIGAHEGETAARAQFQIGECLFALGRHGEAVREFLRVDTMYDAPQWSAAALFESGRCFEAMNKVGEARSQYRRLTAEHANSNWAEAAKERLRAIASPGGS